MSQLSQGVEASLTVLSVEKVKKGRLIGLAVVEFVLDGIPTTMQGVKIVRQPYGLSCEAPCFRHPDGRWLPAVVLTDDLAKAIADEVLAIFADA
jgi:stage V sporulation protein G